MDNSGEHSPTANAREAESGERRGTLTVLLVGLVLAVGAGPLACWISSIASPRFGKIIAAFDYGFEHLGVVLVVAWVVRVAIENASQRAFLNVVDSKVREQIKQSIDRFHRESLAPLDVTIKKLDDEFGFRIRKPGLLDKESLEVLKGMVLSPKLIRPEYDLYLTLEPLSEARGMPGGLIKVGSREEYYVRNITNEVQEYHVEAWIDTMFEPPGISQIDRCDFTRFVWGPEDLRTENDLRPFDLMKMRREGEIKRDHGAVWLKHVLQGGIPAGATYYVEIEASQVMRVTDIFVWNITGLTQRFRVRVGFAGGYTAADFHVDARELHHIGHDAFRDTFKDDSGVLSWSVNQVLLPYQGVEIWWAPRERAQEIDPREAPPQVVPG